MEMSNLVFGVLSVALIVGVFGIFISEVGSDSSADLSSLDQETLDSLNRTNQIVEINDAAQTKFNSTEEANLFDLVGFYFNKGWQGLKVIQSSADVMTDMTEASTEAVGLPPVFLAVFGALMGAALVFILIGAVMKWRV